MAITITATVGSASANSYQTLADANAIIEGLIEDDDVTAWSSASDDAKNRALFTSTIRISITSQPINSFSRYSHTLAFI